MSSNMLAINTTDSPVSSVAVAHTEAEFSRTVVILRLLVEYRFLTTGQLYTLSDHKWPQQTRRELARAREKRLVRSFAYQPTLGNHSELCWQLTARGIHFLEQAEGLSLGHNSSYWRKPALHRIQHRESELELERQVKGAAWRVIRPRTYNQHKPLPNYTRQYKAIATALTYREQRRRGGGQSVDPNGPHTICIPLKTNEYVAQNQDKSQAVVLILCPVRVGEAFWAERVKKYSLLAREIPVVAVFAQSAITRLYQPMLEEGKLVVTTLDRVGSGLLALTR